MRKPRARANVVLPNNYRGPSFRGLPGRRAGRIVSALVAALLGSPRATTTAALASTTGGRGVLHSAQLTRASHDPPPRHLATLTLATALTLATPTAAHASDDYTHTIGRWPAHVTTVCAESSAPSNWKVARAVKVWNRRDMGQPRLILRDHCKVKRVTVRQVHRKVTWGGMASVTRNDDWTLRHVTVKLNRWMASIKPRQQRYRRYISTHEFGHVLGLYHPPAGVNSIMAPGYRYEVRAGVPLWADRRDLARIY